ncbi:PilZ domain-containing protein [Sphingomonas sp. NBWT7]|uniref:PilZ domain-containing protein n=1 Tax=Sphingomonas sp. NBWT7 TaxID=2596913 RepID=UPI0016287637|nr:PilZ domain-containing protein [Sphingomonas sp. NBWT7]QNE32346.1 PilZ domain-containing protein [Sphingomonas sp. NBWT7]
MIDRDDPVPPADAGRMPRAPRQRVMLNAVIERFGGGPATQHRIRDLSSGGARIDQAEDLSPGATVLVSVGALAAVGATVSWVRDGTAGLQFAEQIDLEAARAKAAIAPRTRRNMPVREGPKVGWIPNLDDPYTRR